MENLQNFEQFNEGKIKDFLTKSKDKIFSFLVGRKKKHAAYFIYPHQIKQYDLEVFESQDEQQVQVFHNKRLIADISLDQRYNVPIWVVQKFLYESECPKDPNEQYQKMNKKIEGQVEQPYSYKLAKTPPTDSANSAVKHVIDWWSTETKSGRSKNKSFKAKTSSPVAPMKKLPKKKFDFNLPKA